MRIVIKVGTSTLAYSTGNLNIRHMETLCKVISDIKNAGFEVILVSSGAVGMGMGKLSLSERPRELTLKQAAAAATDVYKDYNKKASFVNLEMVNEWLSTRGEYSFRRDKHNRLQLDISIAEENQVISADHQKIFSCSEQDKVWVQMSSALVPDGVSKASL